MPVPIAQRPLPVAGKSGKTLAARGNSFNGVNLASPAPLQYKPPASGGEFSITDAIAQAQQGQNAANSANNTRYTQGLGVLTGGMTNSRGLIQSALDDTAGLGEKQLRQVRQDEQQGHAATQQNAMNRGIGNTTIVDTLQGGVTKRAEDAKLDVRDMVAKNRSAINLQSANNETAGANSIAGFISGRNDVAPSLNEYANLVSAAAQKSDGTKNTATLTKGSINDPINPSGTPGVQTPAAGGGGALGSQTYFNKGAGLGGDGGAASAAATGAGGGGGGGGGGLYYSAGGNTGGPIANALNGAAPAPLGAPAPAAPATAPSASGGASAVMTAAGYKPGSISLTPGAKPPCRKYNWITDNGLDPASDQFCK